jgi:hypothetical protein
MLSGMSMRAQEVSMHAATDKTEYLIGDFIRFQVTVNNPVNATIVFPSADTLAPFDIITISNIDTIKTGAGYTYKQEIVYSIYDSGAYKIKPVAVKIKYQQDANFYTATSDTVRFFVNTIPVDTLQPIKSIKAPLHVEVKNNRLLYIVFGIALLASFITVLYFAFFRKQQKRITPLKPVTISLHDETMQKLQALDAKKLWQQDAVKEYYVELTDILREYMSRRYAIHAQESTSEEIAEMLVRAGVSGEMLKHANAVLYLADFAKFARSKPTAAENSRSMQQVTEFVIGTSNKEHKNEVE